jgi:ribosomal protein S18 acetylase RimI-like enzyme
MQVLLIAMNEESFSNYLQIAIPSYAKDNIDSGRWEESEALARSRKAHESLLPEGVATINNYLFNVIENESKENLGHIWVKVEDNIHTKSAFIYDIEIFEQYRRKGYAKFALGCIEQVVADLGATSLGLHVFNHNSAAIGLYNSIGYQTVSHNMQKPIRATVT